MKRILFFFSLLISVVGFSQTTNYQKVSTPYQYRWFITDSVIATPYGEIPILRQVGNTTRPGALFTKTLDGDTSLKLWTGYRWKDVGGTGGTTTTCVNGFTSDVSVTYSGTGFTFNIQGTTYNIDCIDYTIIDTTITLSASDPTLNRVDKFYVGTDQLVHVAEGIPGDPALEPQLDGDQLSMAFVSIPAGSTTPALTQQVVYDENTESTVTNLGTTTDPNNTTNVFRGTKSVNVTNINDPSGASVDAVYFDITAGSWNIVGVDGLSMHILLKAVMPTQGNLRVQLFNGTTAVSSEVIVGVNKNNITTYQAITIPIGSFGTITNASITRVRFRYTRSFSTVNYTGFYLDYIFFEDGIGQPVPGGGVSSVGLLFAGNAFSVVNTPVTTSGTLTVNPNGLSTEYINGAFNRVAFPTFSTIGKIGIFDGRAKTANGAVIDLDSIYFWPGDYTYPGMITPAMKMKWDSSYYISNVGDGDSLAFPLNDSVTAIKSIKFTNTWGHTDSTILVDTTGGGGGGGEDLQQTLDIGNNSTTSMVFVNANVTFDYGTGPAAYPGLTFTSGASQPTSTNTFLGNSSEDSSIRFHPSAGPEYYDLDGGLITANRHIRFPDKSGTIAMLDDITGGAAAWGSITGTLSSQTDLQNALDLKAPLASPTFTGTVTLPTPFTLGAVSVLPTGTELNFVDGVTSAIQTQIDGKANTALSNLASVAINTSLVSDADNTDDLGSASVSWKDIYSRTVKLDGATSGTVTINSDALSNTLNGTVLTGTGVIPVYAFSAPITNFTMSDVNTVQPVFTTTQDVITLQPNTRYRFKGKYYFTHGAVSHSVGMSFELGGAGSLTNIDYNATTWATAAGTQTASQTTVNVRVATNTAVNAAGANGQETIEFEGWMTVGAGGTITVTPSITFSAAPTGTCLAVAYGTWIEFYAVGTDAVVSQGPVN